MTPKAYTLWTHSKGGLYLVLGVSKTSTNGRESETQVRYWSFKHEHETVRELSEFMDGRFTQLPTHGGLMGLVQGICHSLTDEDRQKLFGVAERDAECTSAT